MWRPTMYRWPARDFEDARAHACTHARTHARARTHTHKHGPPRTRARMSIITIFLTARRTIQVERPRQLLGRVRVRLAQVLLQGAPAHPRSLPRGVSGYKHEVRVRVGQGGPGRAWAVDPGFVADAENSMPRERFPHEVQAACWRQLPAAERVSAHDWVAVDVEAEVCGGEGTGEVVFGISRVVGGWGALGPDVACDEDDCELWVQVVRVPVASSLPAGVPLSHAIHEPLARRDTHVHVCHGGRHAEAGGCPGVPGGVDGGGSGPAQRAMTWPRMWHRMWRF